MLRTSGWSRPGRLQPIRLQCSRTLPLLAKSFTEGAVNRYIGPGDIRMPRFSFHVEGHSEDLKLDLPTVAAAKCEAVQYASRLICAQAERFWEAGQFHLTVADCDGLILFSLVLTGIDAPCVVTDEMAST